jgi:glycerol-3-phosphate acyltransferase PlsX
VLLDAGANAECSPEWLVQFAQMGATYVRERFEIACPRVALLSIGEEAGKGNALVKSTYALFDDLDWSTVGAQFVGNVEGRDLMAEQADVVVTDGFTGNVALKSLEGAMKAFAAGLFDALGSSPEAASAAEALGPSLDALIKRFHPDTYGGAMLLGTSGVCIISHGASTPIAIANAISVGAEMAEVGLVAKLGESVAPI